MATQYQIIGGESSPIDNETKFDNRDEAQESLEFLQSEYPDAEWEIVEIAD